ncbi:GlxA family transcriptional regulator [Kitasatospora sp. McL0602]|uniref:GlxA family transcriptional regulator n=1 Tax=Kitasatospora sp. McL0602 TaxID=3439530 RepID=UPI003F8CC47B
MHSEAPTDPPHRVVVLALPGVIPFELGIPARIFGSAYSPTGRPLYEITTCSLDGRPVRTQADFTVAVEQDSRAIATADTLVVPPTGYDDPVLTSGRIPAELAEALATRRPGSRLVSICTASFALAAAGLLHGRTATTHWYHSPRFARLFPDVRLDSDVLFVDDGDILTSAGAAAGIDLCLHLVRRDHGSETANGVARRCVVPPWREGGQAQYVDRPVPAAAGPDTAATRAWALDQLHRPLPLAELATHAGMSIRTFSRRFLAETGRTPGQWLTSQRVELARGLLESTDLPIDTVADRAGFGSGSTLRQHVTTALGVSPSAYRRTYRARA